MQEHEKILQLIEQVKPDDTAMLDEIDTYVIEFLGLDFNDCYCLIDSIRVPDAEYIYTRSRDALKAIRPDGYIRIGNDDNDPSLFLCEFITCLPNMAEFEAYAPTEELAELHAIIQAIAYERGQENEQV